MLNQFQQFLRKFSSWTCLQKKNYSFEFTPHDFYSVVIIRFAEFYSGLGTRFRHVQKLFKSRYTLVSIRVTGE